MFDGQFCFGFDLCDDQFVLCVMFVVEYCKLGICFGVEFFDSCVYFMQLGSVVIVNEVNMFEFVQVYVGVDFGSVLGCGSKIEVQLGCFILNFGLCCFVVVDEYCNIINGYIGVWIDFKVVDGSIVMLIYMLL